MLRNDKRKKKTSAIDRILEIPKELASGAPKITITGFEEMLIENYKGILEYEENLVRINTFMGVVIVNGINLSLNQLTEDDMLVKGQIDSLELEATEE